MTLAPIMGEEEVPSGIFFWRVPAASKRSKALFLVSVATMVLASSETETNPSVEDEVSSGQGFAFLLERRRMPFDFARYTDSLTVIFSAPARETPESGASQAVGAPNPPSARG